MSSTREVYLQKRIRNLQIALEAADRLVQDLLRDLELTESAGAAFALDLATCFPETATTMAERWDEALRRGGGS